MAHSSGAGNAALEDLALELAARGLTAQVVTPAGRRPWLEVRNPQAAILSELVVADGSSFWWSWAEPITAVTDVTGAADKLALVLRVR
jgi:hypothetical protein